MSSLDRTSVALLFVVALVTLLVQNAPRTGGLPRPNPRSVASTVPTVVVTGDSVNIRQAPSLSASVLARADRGQELQMMGVQNDWYRVKWGRDSAWLSKLYASSTDDCPTERSAAAGARMVRLTGKWKGEVSGRSATFIFYVRNGWLCAYVLYDGVKEILEVQAAGSDALTLVGKRYERLDGSSAPFSLDIFSGQLVGASERMSGRYSDSSNHRGAWSALRVALQDAQ